jgi:hypothetical protein
MFLQIVLLHPIGHNEAIDTLGYHIASKLEHCSVHKQTHTGLYNIDVSTKKRSSTSQLRAVSRSKNPWGGGGQ